MLAQRTLKSVAKTVGVGLHGGSRVELVLRPAPPNTGIVFRRVDLPNPVVIQVSAQAINDTRLASTMSVGTVRIRTVEHLMSACAGLGIDNLYVDLDGEEVPILDGSAASFVYLLENAGVEIQSEPRRFLKVLKPVEVIENGGTPSEKWARLFPYHGYKLDFRIDFKHPAVDATGQHITFDMGADRYSRDIARARTFTFSKDVEMLRASGLALGGGFDNAIVMDDYKVLNAGGLRYEEEFARHKLLDAIGDLYCVGAPLLASYSAFRSGHGLNNQLLRALLARDDAYEYVTFEDEKCAPKGFAFLAPSF